MTKMMTHESMQKWLGLQLIERANHRPDLPQLRVSRPRESGTAQR